MRKLLGGKRLIFLSFLGKKKEWIILFSRKRKKKRRFWFRASLTPVCGSLMRRKEAKKKEFWNI